MAIVKFNGKQVNGVARLKVMDKSHEKDIGLIQCVCFTGELVDIEFKKCEYVRVECKTDLQDLKSINVATIIGNVDYSKVGNCLFVEGFIKDYNTPSGKYSVDKTTRVCYGTEHYIRNNIQLKNKVKVIHVEGQLLGLSVDISNQSIETVVLGNVKNADIGNCLSVRGTVNNCKVGNRIVCALGKAEVPSLDEIKQQRKDRQMEFDNIFGDFAKNFMKTKLNK